MKDQKNRMVNQRDFRADPNYKPADPEKAKLILKLGTMITDRYLVKYIKTMKYDDPEYWALDEVLTKEEAQFLLNFKKTRVPYDVETLAQMNNMTVEACQKMIDHLCWIGLVEMTREGKEKKKQGTKKIVQKITNSQIFNGSITDSEFNGGGTNNEE